MSQLVLVYIFAHAQKMIPSLEIPNLVADTGSTYTQSIAESLANEDAQLANMFQGMELETRVAGSANRAKTWTGKRSADVFKQTVWTPDGSSLITSNEDHALRLFVAPPDLLSNKEKQPHSLYPYTRTFFSCPIVSFSVFPGFQLADYSTCFAVVSQRGMPIQITNVLSGSQSVGCYKWTDMSNEQFITPSILAFKPDSDYLFAGSQRRLALFNVHNVGSEPEYQWDMPGFGLVSHISHASKQVAVSSYSGGLALYNFDTMGEVAKTSSAPTAQGICQTIWSPNENYLHLICRGASEIPVLDVRMGLRHVATLGGWEGQTGQRLWADRTITGRGLVAGTVDGNVKTWEDIDMGIDRMFESSWKAHSSPISAVSSNPLTGVGVMATSSGERAGDDDDGPIDCSLKLWEFPKEEGSH